MSVTAVVLKVLTKVLAVSAAAAAVDVSTVEVVVIVIVDCVVLVEVVVDGVNREEASKVVADEVKANAGNIVDFVEVKMVIKLVVGVGVCIVSIVIIVGVSCVEVIISVEFFNFILLLSVISKDSLWEVLF